MVWLIFLITNCSETLAFLSAVYFTVILVVWKGAEMDSRKLRLTLRACTLCLGWRQVQSWRSLEING